jgi:hypothetical protein
MRLRHGNPQQKAMWHCCRGLILMWLHKRVRCLHCHLHSLATERLSARAGFCSKTNYFDPVERPLPARLGIASSKSGDGDRCGPQSSTNCYGLVQYVAQNLDMSQLLLAHIFIDNLSKAMHFTCAVLSVTAPISCFPETVNVTEK